MVVTIFRQALYFRFLSEFYIRTDFNFRKHGGTWATPYTCDV